MKKKLSFDEYKKQMTILGIATQAEKDSRQIGWSEAMHMEFTEASKKTQLYKD